MNPTSFPRWPLPFTVLTLIFSFSLGAAASSAVGSTLAAGRSLTGDDTMASEGGKFVLGFFSAVESRNFYIGIWYGNISRRTPVWVANRETPLHDRSSSELRISGDGNLVLLDQFKSQVWSTNTFSIDSNSTVAELLDTGNLVLRDVHNSSRVFWQSFDHPTDTWLPGGKLGRNKLTGEAQKLISWKNSDDPSPGTFSFEVDPDGSSQYLLVWNSSVEFWKSGIWNGKTFPDVPEMVPNFIYNFEYVSNEKESYFTYTSIAPGVRISRSVVDPSGQYKQLAWVDNSQGWTQFWARPKAECDVYRRCGPFGICDDGSVPYCSCVRGFDEASSKEWALGDLSGGCLRRNPLPCEGEIQVRRDRDRFHSMPNMKRMEGRRPSEAQSAGECEAACLSNCSCTAYSYDDRGCSLWYEALLNLRQLPNGSPDGETVYLRLAASEFPTRKPNKRKIAGIAVGAATGLLVASAVVSVLIWRHLRGQLRQLKLVEGSLVPFSYRELKRVTKNFSVKLGAGGFGSVFKGTMPDSTQVAVKKLEGVGQGEKQFRTEVSTIGTIQHVNLVRLRGFCSERTRRLLVYDYMPRGSLGDVLFQDSGDTAFLGWSTRYQIILGTARGLAYLHEKCRDCIIHCDIKPENILLDDSLVPKVGDFGLAKLVGHNFSRVLTTMRGTRGYLAPEWISGVAITAKADVYSYGMTLFEIISGRRNSKEEEKEKFTFFPSRAATALMRGEVMGLLDPRLGGDANLEELNRVFRVAYWCIQGDEASRPSMGQVVQILEGVLDVDMPPIPRFLQYLSESMASVMFFSCVSSHQSSQVPTSNVSAGFQNQSSTSSASND